MNSEGKAGWTRECTTFVAISAMVLLACGQAMGGGAKAPSWHTGALGPHGITIDPLSRPRAVEIWEPKAPPVSARTRPYRCRIVSYADKWTRHGLSVYMSWRHPNGPIARAKALGPERGKHIAFRQDVDVDGDGRTDDDFVASHLFSLTQPLSNPNWPLHMAFPQRHSSRFYGGASWYVSNAKPRAHSVWLEQGYNPDHSPPWFDDRAEDHPLQGQANEKRPDSRLRLAWAILWSKHDLLNGGAKYRVTFDETSRLASITTRGYWLGYDDVRMVALDGQELYISDTEQFDIPKTSYKPKIGRVFTCYPTRATWARYEPKEHRILFDPAGARFEKHEFKDVRAVGWYLAKRTLEGTQAHLKWYGFEADAVVHRPVQGSLHLDMVRVRGNHEVPAFWMSTCEWPYARWKDIHDWGDAPFWTLEGRYVYRKDGDMGSMLFGEKRHGPNEPATNFGLYDALAMCNTLSHLEGKQPCYYIDRGLKTHFRNQHIWTRARRDEEWKPKPGERRARPNPIYDRVPDPKIYVKWDADGHRLPTPAEWRRGVTDKEDGMVGADGTAAVGSKKPNALGLYDMIGNVWEMVWTYGDVYDPEKHDTVTVMGGGFRAGDPMAAENAASPYGDVPANGSAAIGLRPVCREAGLKRPAVGMTPGAAGYTEGRVPVWTFGREQRTAAREEAKPVATGVLDMAPLKGGEYMMNVSLHAPRIKVTISPFDVAKFETTYAKWKRVLQWAEANGYEFSKTGDMGSMYWFYFDHAPDEPVTHLHWHDMAVWCNALSEMEGRTPCYYTDEKRREVYRKAFAFRPIKVDAPTMMPPGEKWYSKYMSGSYGSPEPWLFCRWDADGYRLPTAAEWQFAASAHTGRTSFRDNAKANGSSWSLFNGGGRTHPVGLKRPNAFGLHDTAGNVYEWLYSGQDRSRPIQLDTSNPKYDRYWGWDKPKGWAPKESPRYAGDSFLGSALEEHPFHAVGALHYYPDFGFRVVRCKAGTHVRDGREELGEWPKVVEINPDDYDPLQATDEPGGKGTCWRGNLMRNGAYEVTGVADLKGLKWKVDTGGPVKSTPVVFGGVVYVGSNGGNFHAIDARTGAEKWKVHVKGGVISSACVKDGVVYFGGNDGRLYAVNAKTGEVVWKGRGSGRLTSSPAVAHGMVFMEGPVALDVKAGKQVWAKKGGRLRGPRDGRLSSVLIFRDLLIQNGSVCLIVEARFIRGSGGTWAQENTDALAGGIIFGTGSDTGGGQGGGGPHVYARNLQTGARRWNKITNRSGRIDTRVREVLLCSPAVWGGRVYIGSDHGEMFAQDVLRGKDVWAYQAGGAIRSAPSVSAKDGILYFGCNDGHLYALDARTGDFKWKYKTGGSIASSPCPSGGMVYIGSDDGYLYALEGTARAR